LSSLSFSALLRSKATSLQIQPTETRNRTYNFAGSYNPEQDGGLVNQSAKSCFVSRGYITPAQAGARFINNTRQTLPSDGTEISYIPMPQAIAQ